ncbi:MAG: tetratricopeptide repeat protein [Deltaproteobacteria bacterium]|jgi:tetratricopeptide (TPR) repeat protein|nr:tetratricopeptide repeat protein [Deltaproteobacteria bacterium]
MSQQKNRTLIDSIQTETAKEASPFLEFLIRNSKKITLSIVLIILIAVGVSGWSMYQENRLADAREELGLILAGQDAGARLETLNAFVQRVELAEIKTAALLALAYESAEAGNHALASSAWEELSLLVPADSPMRFTAQMGMANELNNLGKTPEALALLESLLGNAPVELTLAINVALMDLAEKSGQWDKAIQACEAMLNNAPATTDKSYLRQKIAYLQLKKIPAAETE